MAVLMDGSAAACGSGAVLMDGSAAAGGSGPSSWPILDDGDADLDSASEDECEPRRAAPAPATALDELLGEFVDVLYGAEMALPAPAPLTLLDAPMEAADAALSLPPSSPASNSESSRTNEPTAMGRDMVGPASSDGAATPPLFASSLSPLDEDVIGPTSCWGALTKNSLVGCTPGFLVGKAHFKVRSMYLRPCGTRAVRHACHRSMYLRPCTRVAHGSRGAWHACRTARVPHNTCAACLCRTSFARRVGVASTSHSTRCAH